ncbi:hypothetical protein THER_0399 [Thermodesulfovibrio sp. N1]|uniref:DUF72 domain-containing protein n=1 Tax=unclassified Thermodesulfovibrio TaxID=2645936 RepID=UPI00083B1344|nr:MULTISPECIES: DUF72 domain-containing protein [unclassified Thermodesulfovibrio]MDI1472569.1 DUF72 domain-containing protein [Thermodesulfovibrio sp. 1176]ODA44905.1 hypothetical protein THER_0399 [Thermodesulfovibrio sp. N1]
MEQTLRRGLNIFIGTSGWQYGHWKGIFYPEELKYSEWLSYYCKYFSTVEVNVTFYRDVRVSTFEKWYQLTPENFQFSVKLSRQITHFNKLKVNKDLIESFIQKYSTFKYKLGIILIQLPPGLKFDVNLITDFINMLDKKYKYTIEVRNKTFINDNFFEILKQNNIAFCIADSAGRFPYYETITANFIYVRLHGSQKLYASEYSDEELIEWANKIKVWDKDTYIYFDNDYMGYAVKNALKIKKLLEV